MNSVHDSSATALPLFRQRLISRHVHVLAVTAVMLVPLPGQAAETTSTLRVEGLISEVVVTARKREERAIDVPASLNVFSGDTLADSGVVSLIDLQYQTPGLKIESAAGGARLSLRGVGTNITTGGQSVAVHMDGIYLPNSALALTEAFDLERIEVLKGPEGTLYGRNATGGAINTLSKGPGDHFEADGWVGYGSENLIAAQAAVTLPTGERGGLRLAGAYANDDGYTKNINPAGGEIDDRNFGAFRLRGHYDLTDSLSTDFTAQYSRNRGTLGYGGNNVPGDHNLADLAPQRRDIRHINLDTPPRADAKGTILSGTLTWDLGSVTLKSLTGYVDYRDDGRLDGDGAGALIFNNYFVSKSKFFSQEFQLSGGNPQGVNWTSGAYYSRQRSSSGGYEIDAEYPDGEPYLYSRNSISRHNESWAVFGEVTVPLGDKFSVLAGARYTNERQSGEVGFELPLFLPEPVFTSGGVTNDAFTPKLVLQYAADDNHKLYASITRGFKSGGVSLGLSDAEPYRPEKIWAYEIGSKNTFADGRAELSAAAFYYDYTDLQLLSVLFTQAGILTKITNSAKAPIYGFELATTWRPTDHLKLDFNGAYLDTELKGFVSPMTLEELHGLPTPAAPKTSFTAGAEYLFDLGGHGSLTARAEVGYQAKVIFSQFADLNRERQAGYGLVNANLRYEPLDSRYYVALIGRNLFNRDYLTQRFYYEYYSDTAIYGRPRSIEARFGFKF